VEKPGDGEDGFAGRGAVVFCLNDAEGVFFVGFGGGGFGGVMERKVR
jgi:hypothetical protein